MASEGNAQTEKFQESGLKGKTLLKKGFPLNLVALGHGG
jgi:hypothetical protein